jgi:hypothetical protein
MSPCPRPDRLRQLLAVRLAGPEAEAVEAHVEGCAACQQALEELTGNVRGHTVGEAQRRDESGGDFLRRLEQIPPSSACPPPGPDGRTAPGPRPPTREAASAEAPPTVAGYVPVAGGPEVQVFAPDGALFAGQSNAEVPDLVETTTGKTLVQPGLPEQSRMGSGAFSPDGTQLIQQSVDYGYLYAWDLRALCRHLADLDLEAVAEPVRRD